MLAHGDEELRNKADNLYQFNPSLSSVSCLGTAVLRR